MSLPDDLDLDVDCSKLLRALHVSTVWMVLDAVLASGLECILDVLVDTALDNALRTVLQL